MVIIGMGMFFWFYETMNGREGVSVKHVALLNWSKLENQENWLGLL
jgi:hypothetical protein